MKNKDLENVADLFWEDSSEKYIPDDGIYAEKIAGTRMFDKPIFAYADADDPLFKKMQEIGTVGPHHMVPKWWLPSAKTVISFFLPFSQEVKLANSRDFVWPSNEWYHARIDGQRFLLLLAFHVVDFLVGKGYKAVVADSRELQDRADSRFKVGATIQTEGGTKALKNTSNWSERHVAYVCGLGTFGLSKNLITEKGCAGRFGSIITDAQFKASKRNYQDIYEYCNRCGYCIDRCPVQAISLYTGKDHDKCKDFLGKTRIDPPYYGCGKCQLAVPCTNGIPKKIILK